MAIEEKRRVAPNQMVFGGNCACPWACQTVNPIAISCKKQLDESRCVHTFNNSVEAGGVT